MVPRGYREAWVGTALCLLTCGVSLAGGPSKHRLLAHASPQLPGAVVYRCPAATALGRARCHTLSGHLVGTCGWLAVHSGADSPCWCLKTGKARVLTIPPSRTCKGEEVGAAGVLQGAIRPTPSWRRCIEPLFVVGIASTKSWALAGFVCSAAVGADVLLAGTLSDPAHSSHDAADGTGRGVPAAYV